MLFCRGGARIPKSRALPRPHDPASAIRYGRRPGTAASRVLHLRLSKGGARKNPESRALGSESSAARGGALSLQHAPFSKLAMPPRTYSRNLLQIFRQALRFEPTCVSSNPLSLVDRIVNGSPLFGECTAHVCSRQPALPLTRPAWPPLPFIGSDLDKRDKNRILT